MYTVRIPPPPQSFSQKHFEEKIKKMMRKERKCERKRKEE